MQISSGRFEIQRLTCINKEIKRVANGYVLLATLFSHNSPQSLICLDISLNFSASFLSKLPNLGELSRLGLRPALIHTQTSLLVN